MKRIIALCSLLVAIAASVSAQYQLDIKGATFNVYLNDYEMTAAIRDHQYYIDDAKYALRWKRRKFKAINNEQIKTVEIPSTYQARGKTYTITTIGRAAFAGYRNVDYIILPPTITTIEEYAFFRSSIVGIDIPASVTQIGNRAFGWCENLIRLMMPKGIQEGKGLYAESKVRPEYFTADKATIPAQNSLTQRKQAERPSKPQIATSSDVDIDLPTTKKKK